MPAASPSSSPPPPVVVEKKQKKRKKRSRSRSKDKRRKKRRKRSRSGRRKTGKRRDRSPSSEDLKARDARRKHAENQREKTREVRRKQLVIGMYPQITRTARKLFCGNLPSGIRKLGNTGNLNQDGLRDHFNAVLAQKGMARADPIQGVWLAQDQAFCFIEFKAVVDCTQGLDLLYGEKLAGNTLRLSRPSDYKAVPDFLAAYDISGDPPEPPPSFSVSDGEEYTRSERRRERGRDRDRRERKDIPDIPIPGKGIRLQDQLKGKNADTGSNVVKLGNMLKGVKMDVQKVREDTIQDVSSELARLGKLLTLYIPGKDESDYNSIFVVYVSDKAAQKVVRTFNGRKYAGNTLEVELADRDTFLSMVNPGNLVRLDGDGSTLAEVFVR